VDYGTFNSIVDHQEARRECIKMLRLNFQFYSRSSWVSGLCVV